MVSDKNRIKSALVNILRAKAGVWVKFDELVKLLENIIGDKVWQGSLYRAIYELVADREIERTKQTTNAHYEWGNSKLNETLYRVPDNDTPDLFDNTEIKP